MKTSSNNHIRYKMLSPGIYADESEHLSTWAPFAFISFSGIRPLQIVLFCILRFAQLWVCICHREVQIPNTTFRNIVYLHTLPKDRHSRPLSLWQISYGRFHDSVRLLHTTPPLKEKQWAASLQWWNPGKCSQLGYWSPPPAPVISAQELLSSQALGEIEKLNKTALSWYKK